MSCRQYIKRKEGTFWNILLGVTLFICSLLVYQFLVFKGIIYPYQSPYASYSTSPNVSPEKLISDECYSVCHTRECLEITNLILKSMNQSADPCENFYNFACGNFDERFHLEGNVSFMDNHLTGELQRSLRDIIETSEAEHGTAKHKLKVVYESCMNTGSSEMASARSLLQILNHMGIPNWPHLSSNFSFGNPSLPEVLGRLATYEEDIFVTLYVYGEDSSTGNENLFNLTVLPQDTIQGEIEIEFLKKALERILYYIGFDIKEVNKTLEEFFDVDTKVHALYNNHTQWDDICEQENATSVTTLDCTLKSHKNKHWLCRLVESFIRNGRISSRYTKDRVRIGCEYKDYVDRLFNLLNTYEDRVIANYIALRVFINNMKYMEFSVRKNMKEYIRLLSEYSGEQHVLEMDRWKFCVSWLVDNMPLPLGMMYVEKMWPAQATDELNEMVHEYLNTTKHFVSNQQWISESVKEQILEKVNAAKNVIYTIIERMKNETKINELYKTFYPVRTSFMRNVFSHKKLLFIAKKLEQKDMIIFNQFKVFDINAYGSDSVYLTFGILQPPFFQYGYPKLFNIAKLGMITGHEIGHMLLYFFESDKMDNETRESFITKKECITNQYFNYELKLINKFVLGNLTLSENFPDNMGMKVTEKVSEVYLRDMREKRFTLPSLSYSPEELLYISLAQMWCAVRSIEMQEDLYRSDNHSPEEFRVIGSLQSSQRFSQVFNCPATSYMNPRHKCSVFG